MLGVCYGVVFVAGSCRAAGFFAVLLSAAEFQRSVSRQSFARTVGDLESEYSAVKDLCGEHPFTMGKDGVVCLGIAKELGDDVEALLCNDGDVVWIEVWPAGVFESKLGNCCDTTSDVVRSAEQPVELISAGRFRLPMAMAEKAGILPGSACAAAGIGDHIELWNQNALDKTLETLDFFEVFEGIALSVDNRFATMSDSEIKAERLAAKGMLEGFDD